MRCHMNIQNVIFPKIDVCTEDKLYFHYEKLDDKIVSDFEINKYNNVNNSIKIEAAKINADSTNIILNRLEALHFDTYFNSFSIEKWKKYTNIENVSINLTLSGKFKINLYNFCDETFKIIESQVIESEQAISIEIPYKLYEYRGILTFSILSLKDNSVLYGGFFNGSIADEKINPVTIALNICTYKREKYIYRTIDLLNKYIYSNSNSLIASNLYVFITDNGKTLPIDSLSTDKIRIFPNKNVGGAGGFTRGLIEIMHSNLGITHALMMDDDISIEPESIYRTFTMLACRKQEYENMFIGGAMLRLDKPNIQIESGASWNAGNLIPNKHNIDLSSNINVLNNEIEEYTEYNAWWYCCTPMSLVNRNNLPLPIFIRGDDLEYGLRNIPTLVLLNGICVWHEPFENKYSSFLQYYILRNLLYDNTLHFKQYSKYSFLKRLYSFVLRDLVFYRYKNIDLIFKGINDYFKGINFFQKDGEELHQEIMAAGYKNLPVTEIPNVAFNIDTYNKSLNYSESRLHRFFRLLTFNGYFLPTKKRKNKRVQIVHIGLCKPVHFFREKYVLNYDKISCKGFVTEKSLSKFIYYNIKLLLMTLKILFKFNSTRKKMANDMKLLMTEDFWNKYLKIDKNNS